MTHYRLLKYSPDAAHDESIVLAVVAYDERLVTTRITKDWERVAAFAREHNTFLRTVAEEWVDLLDGWTPAQVAGHRCSCMSSFYLSEPRASLLNPHALADRLAGRLLAGERTSNEREPIEETS